MIEIPEDIRIPLHELQADIRYLFGRVSADSSVAGEMAESASVKLRAIEAAIIAAFKGANEKDEVLEECFEYFDNKQDADYSSETGFIPNREMVLASRIKEATGEA